MKLNCVEIPQIAQTSARAREKSWAELRATW